MLSFGKNLYKFCTNRKEKSIKKTKLSRAKIGTKLGLDVTIKNATGLAKYFAPAWEMVMNHKKGLISDAQYKYLSILSRAHKLGIPTLLYSSLIDKTNKLTFLCFCKDNSFCHTYLLITWLCSTYPEMFERA